MTRGGERHGVQVKDRTWGWEWGAGGRLQRALWDLLEAWAFFGSGGSRGRAVSRGATWVDWAVGRYLLQGEGTDGRDTRQEMGDKLGRCHCFQAAVDEHQNQESGSWGGEEGMNLRCVGSKHFRTWWLIGCKGQRKGSAKEGLWDSSLNERRNEWVNGKLRTRVSCYETSLSLILGPRTKQTMFLLPQGRLPVLVKALPPNCRACPEKRKELHMGQRSERIFSFCPHLSDLSWIRWVFSVNGYRTRSCTMKWNVPFSHTLKNVINIYNVFLTTYQVQQTSF